MDGTFKIVPKEFYQIITILVYSELHSVEIPAAYILTSCKSECLYRLAFSTLTLICETLNIKIQPTTIMSDFEKGLRKALLQVFPQCKLLGCFFHYSKALWQKASKLGLRTLSHLEGAKILIGFMKILVHLPFEKRNELFQILTNHYNNDPKFKSFLGYYKKNWLFTYYISPNEFSVDNNFTRTNNSCERYNYRLHVGMEHPRLSILVTVLLEEEAFFKKVGLNNYCSIQKIELSKVYNNVKNISDKLPFKQLSFAIQEMINDHGKINEIFNKKEFVPQIISLFDECEKLFFFNFSLSNEKLREEKKKIENVVEQNQLSHLENSHVAFEEKVNDFMDKVIIQKC